MKVILVVLTLCALMFAAVAAKVPGSASGTITAPGDTVLLDHLQSATPPVEVSISRTWTGSIIVQRHHYSGGGVFAWETIDTRTSDGITVYSGFANDAYRCVGGDDFSGSADVTLTTL